MHIEPEHRLRQISIAPPDIGIRYVIIDRPLADKLRDAGWRTEKGLVEKYHRLFPERVAAVLKGDGKPQIQVLDLRPGGLDAGSASWWRRRHKRRRTYNSSDSRRVYRANSSVAMSTAIEARR